MAEMDARQMMKKYKNKKDWESSPRVVEGKRKRSQWAEEKSGYQDASASANIMQRYHNRQYGGSPICIEWEAAAKNLLAGHASRWGEAEKPPLLSLCLRVSLSHFLSLWSNLNSQWHNSPFIFLFSPVSDFSVSLSNDGHYLLHPPLFSSLFFCVKGPGWQKSNGSLTLLCVLLSVYSILT